MTDEDPSQDRIAQLIERINQMDEMLRQQAWRLYHLEQRLGLVPPPRPQTPMPPQPMPPQPVPPAAARETTAPPPASAAAPPRQSTVDETRTPPSGYNQPPPVRPQTPPSYQALPQQIAPPTFGQQRPRPRGDLEARIGGNWFQRIGVVAFALGIAFFLKYAYDNEWIGKNGALWICIAIGVGFLVGGERLRPRYHSYAYGLTGLGIAVLYTCFYAAYGQLQLWSLAPAFIGMIIVTALASLLAARYNALPIAVLGLIGGFLTPIVLSTGHDNEAGLFSYIALLDLGVLALAYSKQWRSLNYLAFGATVLMFVGWYGEWYAPEKLWPTLGFLTLFFAIFALLAVLYNVVNRRQTSWLDLAMVFANALLYFGASYSLLESEYRTKLGLFAVLVSVFYLALGYFTYRRDREDRLLLYTFCGLAILFAVLAVPIQFHQHWVTMGWAIEGAILTWIGLRARDRVSRSGATLIFLIAASHWLLFDAMDGAQANEAFTPLWNRRALSCVVLIACLLLAAAFYKRLGARVEASERATFSGLFLLGANALAVILLSLDVNTYFEHRIQQENQSQSVLRERLDSTRHLTLTVLWVAYAMAMLVVGLRQRLKPVHAAGLLLLALAVVKAIVVDLRYYDAVWHQPFANPTFATFVTLIAATGLCAWLYARTDQLEEGERNGLFVLMLIAANALAVTALSAEAVGYFSARLAESGLTVERERDLRLAQQLWLTVVWAVYGGALLTVGLARRQALLRVMALVLLAMTIVKVYVLDIWSLARLYRIVALILLGVVLLLVSFLYQPLRRRLAEADSEAEQ